MWMWMKVCVKGLGGILGEVWIRVKVYQLVHVHVHVHVQVVIYDTST